MIIVYNDKGVSQNCLQALLAFFELNFPQYPLQIVNSDTILDYLDKSSLLVIGGGADLPYAEKLNGTKNLAIKNHIRLGGAYLGICAGAYYACSSINFTGDGYEIHQDRELSLFEGVGVGSLPELTGGHYFSESSLAKSVVTLNNQESFYYHGGCAFDKLNGVEILASYQDNLKPAIIRGKFGEGRFLLSGVHFEVTKTRYEDFKIAPEYCVSNHENEIQTSLREGDSEQIISWIKDLL
ncbi:MAG: BPL-N domain-containing protein [Brevinema sp.]